MKNMIEISGLNKSFGKVQAVRDLSFSVGEGQLFAFLGSNGAGKSTTINIICGVLAADSGCVKVGGYDVGGELDAVKGAIGVVFQSSHLDRALTVRECLESRAALYGIHGREFCERLSELAELLDFSDILDRTIGKLSGGQRRRIDIARALLHRPRLLILDEPTTGLDPQTRQLLWRVISEMRRRENMTVLLTTHYMEEAADADYIVIIDGGSIRAEGTPLELKNRYAYDSVALYGVSEEAVAALSLPYTKIAGGFRLRAEDTGDINALVIKNPELFRDFEVVKGKMDDVFLAVTGKSIGGEIK